MLRVERTNYDVSLNGFVLGTTLWVNRSLESFSSRNGAHGSIVFPPHTFRFGHASLGAAWKQITHVYELDAWRSFCSLQLHHHPCSPCLAPCSASRRSVLTLLPMRS